MAIEFTRGETPSIPLVAKDGTGALINLTGATFQTQMKGPNGQAVTFDNSKHTADADQSANKGQFILALNSTDSQSIGIGSGKEIVTKITISGVITYVRGSILTVKSEFPQS